LEPGADELRVVATDRAIADICDDYENDSSWWRRVVDKVRYRIGAPVWFKLAKLRQV
jgi:hypothetical protein